MLHSRGDSAAQPRGLAPLMVISLLAAAAPAQRQFGELARRSLPAVEGDAFQAVAIGDVDRDGDPDLVVAVLRGQNRLFLNDGRGVYADATAARMPRDGDRTRAVALGDVDGDGDLDLVCGNGAGPAGEQNRVYLNDGRGVFTDATASSLPAGAAATSAVALGDVDGDGDLDLVCGTGWSGQGPGEWPIGGPNALYLNDGRGNFTDATAARLPPDREMSEAVALGDVDGDGDLDLVVGNVTHVILGSWDRLYLNDGAGTFADVSATHVPFVNDPTSSVALGDVDGDGDLDLVTGNSGAQNRLLLNDGRGRFADATAVGLPRDSDATASVVLGDVDGDGDLDLLVGNDRAEQDRLLLNDGSGVFVDHTPTRMPPGASEVRAAAFADLDGDGDLDAVLTGSDRHRILVNLQRQLHAPVAPAIGRSYDLDVYLRHLPATSISQAAISLSPSPASIPLPPLGTLGIDPSQMISLPPLAIPQPAGVGTLVIPVPNRPALVGQPLYCQALLLAAASDVRLSAVVLDVIRR